jgi:DNA-binding transcriptional ArsR family regulator
MGGIQVATEKEENQYTSTEVVDHFYSPVVEAIALLSSLVRPIQHEFLEPTHRELWQELTDDTKEFIHNWQKITDWDLINLYSLLIPFPYFNDINQFSQMIMTIPNEEFLYHFFGEDISIDQIKELLSNPYSIDKFDTHILWETTDKRNFIIELTSNINSIRKMMAKLLLEVTQSKVFKNSTNSNKETINKFILEAKSLKMTALNIAQYIMGKTFKRTSQYKIYYFIPSYFFTPHRMRIFNSEICIVIYGCAEPLSDSRETSVDLEVKLKALSDRNRLQILHMLSSKKEYGAKLAEYLGITTATVSHHLELLKKAGFVNEEKVGNIKYFSCNQEFTDEFFGHLKKFITPVKTKG